MTRSPASSRAAGPRFGCGRRVAGALAVVVGTFALAGCGAGVTTDIHVTGDRSAAISVSAAFDGEAASVIAREPDTRAALEKVFTDRTGIAPSYDSRGGTVTVSETVPYRKLTASSALTGIDSLTLSGSGKHVTLTADLAAPTAVAAAVKTATAKQPDAAALAKTMLQQTTVAVAVTFDGGIQHADGPGGISQHGNTVTYTRKAGSTAAGTLSVTGNPHASDTLWWVVGSIAVAAAAAASVWAVRRRGGPGTAR